MQALSSTLADLKVWSFRFVAAASKKFQADQLSLWAGGLTYTTLCSLVPLLAVTFSVLKAFGIQNRLKPFLVQALEPLGPERDRITTYVIEFVGNIQVGVLGAVGVAVLFYTVISLIGQIEDALNSIWRVRRPHSWTQKFSGYLSVVLVGPVLVFTALTLIASAQSSEFVQRLIEIRPLGLLVVMVTRVMPLVFLGVAFAFLYKFLTNTQVRLRSALVGGGVAGLLWQAASAGFAAFVAGSASYAAIYSSFAILILFLVWLWVGWLIILVGGEIAYFHQYPHTYGNAASLRGDSPLFQERLALAALVAITQRYLAGQAPWYPTELAAALGTPLTNLEECLDKFVQHGFLLWTAEPAGVALGRPPEQITGIEILDALHGSASGELTQNGTDPVWNLLQRRDQAVRQALAGITLRSLAEEV